MPLWFFFFLMGLSKMGSVSLPLEPALINRGSTYVSVVSFPPRLPLQGGPGRWDLLKDSHLCQKVSHLFLPGSPSCQAKVIIWPLNLWLTRDSQTSQEEPRKAANVTHRTMKYKSLSAADARKKKKGSGSAWIYGASKGSPKSRAVLHICNPSTCEVQQEDYEFQASLGYTARPLLTNQKRTFTQTLHVMV